MLSLILLLGLLQNGPEALPVAQADPPRWCRRTLAGQPIENAAASASIARPGGTGTRGGPPFRWIFDNPPAEPWYPSHVALGGWGSEVIAGLELNAPQIDIFSGYDGDPPVPLLIHRPVTSWIHILEVAAARDGTTMAAAVTELDMSTQRYRVAIIRYQASHGAPLWTYDFPGPDVESGVVSVSTDGSVIAAAAYDRTTATIEIRIFGPDSSVPVLSVSQHAPEWPPALMDFQLSADGTRLLVHGAAYLTLIFDVATGEIIQVLDAGTSTRCNSISGDGSLVATGAPVNRLFEWDPAHRRYEPILSVGIDFPTSCDLSDDGSTYALSTMVRSRVAAFRVISIDVPSRKFLFNTIIEGTGDYQNVASGISAAADGSRFVVGSWGDRMQVTPELLVFSRDDPVPLLQVDYPGSVMGVSMDRLGQTVAVISLHRHANQWNNGGAVSLVDCEPRRLDWAGVPRAGQSATVTVRGLPGDPYLLFLSGGLTAEGVDTGLCDGLFYLDTARGVFLVRSARIPSGGESTFPAIIPPAVPPGTGFAMQGAVLGASCRLTNPLFFQTVP